MKSCLSIFIILTFCLAISQFAEAQEYQRKVSIEWEAMEAAKSYDLEFTKIPATDKTKPLLIKSKTTEWTGMMAPGSYMMRIRARDRRNVPGTWSAAEEFKVNLEAAKLVSPKSQDKLMTDQTTEAEINLEWAPVGMATEYDLEVTSEDGQTKIFKTLDETKFSLSLPVSKNYTWKILAKNGEMQSDAATVDQFTVLGKKLEKPKVEEPENEWVRELKWASPEGVESFDYAVVRFEPNEKKWQVVEKLDGFKGNQIPFKEEWPGGKYRFVLRANGNLRPNSDTQEMRFTVAEGNRSPQAEYTQTMRQSIDRTSGLFGIASYLVTMIDYAGQARDTGGNVKFSSVGGTGRVGLGYLTQKSPWGFLGIADYSGFFVDDKVYNFATLELNAIYRQRSSQVNESRHQMGLFYKELPEIRGNAIQGYTGTETLAAVGPHYGYEYWKALTPKVGLQFNAHAYMSIMKVKTTNDGELKPTLSYQLGLLGSYRFNKNMTGLAGYAYRKDSMSYRTTTIFSGDDKNTVDVQGHYLNLFLEWAL